MIQGGKGSGPGRELDVGDADAFYAAVIEAHAGLSQDESIALNARLVLLLANRVGDMTVLKEAIATARRSLPTGNSAQPESESRS